MLHPPGFAPTRPINVPFLVAANGPKGIAIARELGDGLIYGGRPEATPKGFPMLQLGVGGILLDDGETLASSRVLEKAKMLLALQYHLAYEGYHNPPLPVEQLPRGAEWLEMVEQFPPERRHLYVHDRHMVEVNAHDRGFVERYPDSVVQFAGGVVFTAEQLRERVQSLVSLGATRVSCGASFGDWEQDMKRYANALALERRAE